MNKKKNIMNLLFLLFIFSLTIYGVFEGEDIGELINTITKANGFYLTIGVLCVIFFIWCESIIIYYMMGTLQVKNKKRTCFMYSCIGFFFSCITPSASGGQPAQIYYMRKNKIPISISTLVLMVITLTYKSVLVFIGLFLVLFQHRFVVKYLTGILPVFSLGVGLNVICCIVMLLLIFYPALTENLILACFKALVKLHLVKETSKIKKRILHSMEQYSVTTDYLKQNKKVLFHVIIITFIQRISLFFVTYFVYKAFGLAGTSWYDIVMLQAAISVAVDMLPLPGGMGISEKLFLTIFIPVFGTDLLLPGMVLSRGIAYYVQLLLSAGGTVLAHFYIGKKSE